MADDTTHQRSSDQRDPLKPPEVPRRPHPPSPTPPMPASPAPVAIPTLVVVRGAAWRVLPAGVHTADLNALAAAFATNTWRRKLFDGLLRASRDLHRAGCQRIYVDGSYVTNKPNPGDYDLCWDPEGVNQELLDSAFLDTSETGRLAQKVKYGGEFFPSSFLEYVSRTTFLEFFQTDRRSHIRKGIVQVNLTDDPMIQKS